MPIGIASSRSRVPLERSRSVVTLVTRNITMNGNIASSAGPNRSKVAGRSPSNIHQSSVISRHGSTSSMRRACGGRGGAGCSTRPATARVIRGVMPRRLHDREERRLDVGRRRPSRLISSGVPSAMIRAVAHQQQPVAALGLVHHVAGDEDRRPVVGEAVEQRPQVAAQHRVEARPWARRARAGRAAEQGDREAGPGALAAAEPADDLVGVRAEVDRLDDPVHLVAGRRRAPGRRTRRFSATVRSSYTLAAWVT